MDWVNKNKISNFTFRPIYSFTTIYVLYRPKFLWAGVICILMYRSAGWFVVENMSLLHTLRLSGVRHTHNLMEYFV